MWAVYQTTEFEKDFRRLPDYEQQRVRKIVAQLQANPFTGKPLGYRFFREKKFDGRRLYFLVYEAAVIVLLVALSGKKDQPATIDSVKAAFKEYREEISKLPAFK